MANDNIYQRVTEHYGNTARGKGDRNYSQTVAQAFGYSAEDLAAIPQEANLGLSCGNPLALANLRKGETVVDLGSGAGFDVFQAAQRVGPEGQAIGVDMNKDMLFKASLNKEKAKVTNVSFVESQITGIALRDSMADCVISNCVINLVPETEKQSVFHEMYRILKPGGRVALSDILSKKELSPEIKNDMALYVGCIAGASQVNQYETYLRDAGFRDILIVDSGNDLNVYKQASDDKAADNVSSCGSDENKQRVFSCCTPGQENGAINKMLTETYGDLDLNAWAASYKIYALKPSVA